MLTSSIMMVGPLGVAASNNHIDVVKYLVSKGADVNIGEGLASSYCW